MSKKRTSTDFKYSTQNDNNAKRAKCTLSYDTTLLDLPIELLADIFIKAVVMEVKDMKLVKRVWEEKAMLVIDRLQEVCSQWSSILTTNYIRQKIFKTLATSDEEILRMDIMEQHASPFHVISLTSAESDLYVLHKDAGEFFVTISDIQNPCRRPFTVPLPGSTPESITACGVRGCVYIVYKVKLGRSIDILKKSNERDFQMERLFSYIPVTSAKLSVSAEGNLILLATQHQDTCSFVCLYDVNGELLHKLTFDNLRYRFSRMNAAIQNSNGNLVITYDTYNQLSGGIVEVDLRGDVVRRCDLSCTPGSTICAADNYGRMVIAEEGKELILIDKELNALLYNDTTQSQNRFFAPLRMAYNSHLSEIVFMGPLVNRTVMRYYITNLRFV